jgi:hypothetical protein
VPVFRYALEHWEADPFQITVFHRGELSEAQRRLIPADQLANARVQTVDLAARPPAEFLGLWEEQKTAVLPWVMVRFPRVTNIHATVIAGPLQELAGRLFESPARKELVERLGAGESAVWVLLESGDKVKDDAAAVLIEQRLERLMGAMTLPKLDEQDIVNGLVSIAEEELRLEFSLLRVARDAAGEQALVRMLLATESDLAGIKEPMVFPVFGRGRALYALVGPGIRAENIDEAAAFLVGKCSCQIKERNPGVDLLLSADWRSLVKLSPDLARKLPSLAEVDSSAPVTVTATPRAAGAAPSRSPLWLLAIFYGVSPLFLALAVLLLWKKKRRG